ncbi:unnamed protein product [Chondrus crispus]|uniref:PHD-type domain-containing protein n=1 Tax=Chondrus crispus TaxID=2769 RepID=R7QI87_CHOCR|nr:unnamed protein product [Chondrus crispus]CDF37186.1 unnamed protein product [Chondrus crispus]|eukprot:XP_005717005.1 unnamed protein product [Chondrus crispus]
MSDPHADAGVAGAEALLGLAAGNNVRLPSLQRLPGPPSVREPPPLELPTQNLHTNQTASNVSEPVPQSNSVFLQTPPSLSIPLHHASSQPQQQPPPDEQPKAPHPPQSSSQPHVTSMPPQSHYVASHHLPHPPPPHHPHELSHPAARPPPPAPYLPPPQSSAPGSHPMRHELPSVASLSQWAPRPPPLTDANAHYSIPPPRPAYETMHHASPPPIPSLQASSAHLSAHSHLQQSPPGWESQRALPPAHDYWPPTPPHHGYTYGHPAGYYYHQGYYHSAPPPHATATLPQPHLPAPAPSGVHVPPYSIPTTLHQPSSVMRPPSLALPVPVQHGVSGPSPHGLRTELPPVHDSHSLRAPLPSIDPSHYIMPKDDLLLVAQKRAAMSEKAVSRVPDIETAFGPALQANAKRQAEVNATLSGPARVPSPEPKPHTESQTAEHRSDPIMKNDEAVKKPRSGIFDIVNLKNKSPGRTSSDSEDEKEKKIIDQLVALPEKGTRRRQKPKQVRDSEKGSAQRENEGVKGQVSVEVVKAEISPRASQQISESTDSLDRNGASNEANGHKPLRSPQQSTPLEAALMEVERADSEKVEEEEGESEQTVCPCGSEESSGLMIACDECNTWQHSECMGIGENSKVQKYYCDRCRPEEIRPNCVAQRKYKERVLAREKAIREPTKEFDSILVGIKPLELRKHFAIDLKEKSTGRQPSKGEVFYRFATLLRSPFGKYRQSVIEGIVLLLEIPRAEVVARLDALLKRLRTKNGDKTGEEHSENINARTQSHGRTNPQKRQRPISGVLDQADAMQNMRVDLGNPGDAITDHDMTSAEHATSRAMSREERKLQQTMKLFARLEEEEQRERGKKKPRMGEAGGSPKPGQTSKVKHGLLSPPVHAPSPKSSVRHPRKDHDDRKSNVPAIQRSSEEKKVDVSLERDKPRKDSIVPKSPRLRRDQPDHLQTPQLTKTSQKGSGVSMVEPVPVTRDQTKRAREHKNNDKPEKPSARRRDSRSPDTTVPGGRRHCIQERERSQDRKKRRGGASTRESERRQSVEKAQARQDLLLDFELYVPGRSVLGSRLIPRARLSELERERIDMEVSVEFREKERRLPTKKHHLHKSLADMKRSKEWDTKAPAKRRFQAVGKDSSSSYQEAGPLPTGKAKVEFTIMRNSTPEGVHMVLISERGKLHDKGEMFDSPHLIVSCSKDKSSVVPEKEKHTGDNICLKKRGKRLSRKKKVDGLDGPSLSDTPSALSLPPQPKVPTSPQPKSPVSPNPTSPLVRPSTSSPKLTRSPMLRSLPAPVVQGTFKKEKTTLSASQPIIGATIPSFKSSRSPSPDHKALNRPVLSSGWKGSPGGGPHKNREKVEHELLKTSAFPNRLSTGIVPSMKPQSGFGQNASEGKASTESMNGNSLRPLRSTVVPEAKNGRSPNLEPKDNKMKDLHKAESPLPSPRRKPSSAVGVSDILQQRLEGFLKPSATSPRELSIGALPRSAKPLSHSSHQNFTSGRPSAYSKPQVDGSSHGALPSFSNRTIEKSKSWRSPTPVHRRPYNSYNASKGSPSSGSPLGLGGRVSPYENGHKAPFRSARMEAPRNDDSSRNGPRPTWKQYPRKNGWTGGIVKPQHQTSSEANARANRRGRQ